MIKFNWGTGITAFLIAFLLLGFYFIYFSFQHHNDLVEDDYYEQGANYDEQMIIDKRSYAFKDSIQAKNQGNYIELSFSPSISAMSETMEAYFYFPSDERKDYRLKITDLSKAALVDKNLLAKGRYIMKFTWYGNQEKYMTKQDLFVTK